MLELYARKIMQGFIEEILAIPGEGARLALQNIQKSVEGYASQAAADILQAIPQSVQAGLRVSCLGKFRVMKAALEIPPEQWKSRKAKMLFKLLVYMRPRGYVSKEVFMEHLWPEEDPLKTAKRFHVALTTLRRILEPGLERGRSSAYLKSEGDTYLLDLGKDGYVDVDAFEEACVKANSSPDESLSIRALLDADRLYTGGYLEEDLYEPWCMQERERLKDLHLSALASIIDYFKLHRELETAIKYCNSYLSIDAYAEDIYQILLKLYSLTGNRPMVLKTYERCRENIITDLGCPLSRETELLAGELLRG
jgi:two-component SAPR family response regulator